MTKLKFKINLNSRVKACSLQGINLTDISAFIRMDGDTKETFKINLKVQKWEKKNLNN